jgi:hypothetical protein
MTPFDSLSPEEFVTTAFIISIAVASDSTVKDNTVIGTFISLVGDIILTFAAQQEIIKKSSDNNDDSDNNSDND